MTLSFEGWCQYMFAENSRERRSYNEQPYESFNEYKLKNKDFLTQSYERYCNGYQVGQDIG